jgi:hypothetical protein
MQFLSFELKMSIFKLKTRPKQHLASLSLDIVLPAGLKNYWTFVLVSVLIEYLLDEYGFQGTLFILGGCMLHLCISGALYRPLHVHVLITRNKQMRKQQVSILLNFFLCH